MKTLCWRVQWKPEFRNLQPDCTPWQCEGFLKINNSPSPKKPVILTSSCFFLFLFLKYHKPRNCRNLLWCHVQAELVIIKAFKVSNKKLLDHHLLKISWSCSMNSIMKYILHSSGSKLHWNACHRSLSTY